MADPATIAALLGSIKTAWDFTKQRADELKDQQLSQQLSEMGSKIMDLQTVLIEMQQEQSTLIQAKEDAEVEIKRLREWDAESAGYSLHSVSPGVFVYSKEKNREPTTESPWLCIKCYGDRKTSLLLKRSGSEYGTTYFCPVCDTSIRVDFGNRGSHKRGPSNWRL